MQEEREHLVKKIFPEIRSLCRERGITFTEVDLRWGLTDEDVVLGQVIRTCLEEIDKCRPYFIGLVGERYGYVPEMHEYFKDPELLVRWPWLEDAALEGASITDIEFRHGVLNDPEAARSGRIFLRRQRRSLDESSEEEESTPLDGLKRRIDAADLRVEEFRDPVSLGEMVYDELIEILRNDFADVTPPSPLDEERARHKAFAASRRRAYIPNPDYLRRLGEWLEREDHPLVIYAESGSGKSSLISYWCESLRRRQPDLAIIEHYVGIGAGDGDHLGIIRHVMEEIRILYDRQEEIPTKPEELEREFANWLGFGVGKPLLLVIDGVNQLSGNALDLQWLPPSMPEGVRLIVSSTVEGSLVNLRARGWPTLGMQPLKEREREAIVVRFLAEYQKALSTDQIRLIAEDAKSAHPLFLRTLLEELRIYGRHDQLDRRLAELLEVTGTEDLFQQVIERLEDDFGTKAVREVMSALWASRNGLSEEEIEEVTGISRLKLSTLLLGLDYHLIRRDGVLAFFHDYLRRAVQKRYLSERETEREWWRRLADYFEETAITLRSTLELLTARHRLGDREGIDRMLGNLERFNLLWSAEPEELLHTLAGHQPQEVVAALATGLQEYVEISESDRSRSSTLLNALRLYHRVGAVAEAEELARELLQQVEAAGDRALECEVNKTFWPLLLLLGRTNEVEEAARRAESMARDQDDPHYLMLSIANRGVTSFDRGSYDEAMEFFVRHEEIARRLEIPQSIASALGNQALVYSDRGDHERAFECYRETEELLRRIGDRRGLASLLGNRGILHTKRGEYEEMLEAYTLQEKIVRELGDRKGLTHALANRGIASLHRGRYDEALACFNEQEEIARMLGDRRGITGAIANQGALHAERGDDEKALHCFVQHEALARELENRRTLYIALDNRGNLHIRRKQFEEALACFNEQERLAHELDNPLFVAGALGNRGKVEIERGEYEKGVRAFYSIITELRKTGSAYVLTGWLLCKADALVRIVEDARRTEENTTEKEMPTWLPGLLDNVEEGTWATRLLQEAGAITDELIELCTTRSIARPLAEARVITERIERLRSAG